MCFEKPASTTVDSGSITEAAERSDSLGTHLSLIDAHNPTQISQNALCVVRWQKQTSLRSSQCLNVSVIDL